MDSEPTSSASRPPVKNFVLAPPTVVNLVQTALNRPAVALTPQSIRAVEDQLGRFIDALMTADLNSNAFKLRLDSAYALGKTEAAIAARLLQKPFLESNFIDAGKSPVFKAMGELRAQFERLNPYVQGDLTASKKLLGLIRQGNKLKGYFRKFENSAKALQKAIHQLYLARGSVQRDVDEIGVTRVKLMESRKKLAEVAHFVRALDFDLALRTASLHEVDPLRVCAFEQEVLFYSRQNLQDIQAQETICANACLALDMQEKAGREMVKGCTRVLLLSLSAWGVAQAMARASEIQVQLPELLMAGTSTVDGQFIDMRSQLNGYLKDVEQTASDPVVGIKALMQGFDLVFKALDAMDGFRSQAITAMSKNVALIQQQVSSTNYFADRAMLKPSREIALLGGPVAL